MVATPVVSWDWCKNMRPVPMVVFHGTADRFALYSGGENFLTTEPLPSMETWFLSWGKRNHCGNAPTTTALADDLILREHTDCAQEATARMYTLTGSGHIWPGGLKLPEVGTGPYSASINATEVMWEFFQRHRLNIAADIGSTFPLQ
jgi:polyhydroxybutyrate depolymerase